MKIFLTGGTGFIGRQVSQKLAKSGRDLLLLVRQPEKKHYQKFSRRIKFVYGDLSNTRDWAQKLKRYKPDILVHLAWEGLPQTNSEISIKNLISSLNLFSLAAESGCRHIIAVGTQWEYGNRDGVAKETDCPKPFNSLAAAKIALYYFGLEIAKEKNIKFSWLRLFSVYGPGQREGALIPTVVRALRDKMEPRLKALDVKNDFIYVDDIARAVSGVMINQKSQIAVYNVGSGKLTKVRDIVERLFKSFGRRMDKSLVSQGISHIPELKADISKIKKEIGWEPAYDMEKGIKLFLKYYNEKH